jgi:lipopolysaccharide/colanic/teichoic acid biosynthesis glycosyltransferase
MSSSNQVRIPGWKRALDIILVLASLPVVLPLALFIAGLIWMVSSGPILFKQERVGFQGRRFMCFKFRTMAVNATITVHQEYLNHLMNSNAPMVKMDARGDPRVIPFGALLRASGLDELPQIINVLFGEMSLVGPRPCLPYEYDQYLPWQKDRFNTLPGLTGLWQVSGKNRTTFVEMIRLDIAYARNQTPWLDLKIILKTLPVLIGQMRDARKGEKSPSRPVSAKTAAPTLAASPDSMPPPAYTTFSRTYDYFTRQNGGTDKTKIWRLK